MSSAQPQNNESPKSKETTKALWGKPFVWIGGIIVAAAAAWLTEVFTGALTMLFDADRYGDPIVVQVDVEASRSDQAVSLPPHASVSKEDAAKVYPAGAQQQANLLAARGGIVIGQRSMMVIITGKRPDPVRVTDIRDTSECSSPPRGGALVWLSQPFRGQIDPSIRVALDIGAPDQHVYLSDPTANEKKPFFSDKTILLKKGESHVMMIDLKPPAGMVCRPQLEMTVLDGDKTHKQKLVPEDQRNQVMDGPDAAEYKQVLLWGNVCQNLVSAPPNWQELPDPCMQN